MKLEQLLLLDEMIKEIHLEKLCIRIYSKIIQLIKIYTEDCIHTIFHFLTNVIWFIILSSCSILDNFLFFWMTLYYIMKNLLFLTLGFKNFYITWATQSKFWWKQSVFEFYVLRSKWLKKKKTEKENLFYLWIKKKKKKICVIRCWLSNLSRRDVKPSTIA